MSLGNLSTARRPCRMAYNANMFHRVRYQVQYANPINYALEANKLANIIKLYNQDSDSLFVR
jgi:hypothetical protein